MVATTDLTCKEKYYKRLLSHSPILTHSEQDPPRSMLTLHKIADKEVRLARCGTFTHTRDPHG